MSPDDCEDSSGDIDAGGGGKYGNNSQSDDEKAPKMDLPKINLGSDPDFNANITSKRYVLPSLPRNGSFLTVLVK